MFSLNCELFEMIQNLFRNSVIPLVTVKTCKNHCRIRIAALERSDKSDSANDVKDS